MGILYPAVVWKSEALRPVSPALWLAGICVLRLFTTRSSLERGFLAATAGFAALITFNQNPRVTRLYPVLINGFLLAYFGSTLLWPPTIVERFARLRHRIFPQRAVDYTRVVTVVWCLFFFINGTIALATSLWASTAVWSLYNGVISYVLIGVLFAAELVFRRRMWRLANGEASADD